MKKQRQTEAKKKNEESWYVLMGFDTTDKDQQGMLALNPDKKSPLSDSYKIVHDVHEAMKFPSENVDGLSSFGTPEQWLEFFSREQELKHWKFHLMKVLKPKSRHDKTK